MFGKVIPIISSQPKAVTGKLDPKIAYKGNVDRSHIVKGEDSVNIESLLVMILNKLNRGESLSDKEMEYLKYKDPIIYNCAVQIEGERQNFIYSLQNENALEYYKKKKEKINKTLNDLYIAEYKDKGNDENNRQITLFMYIGKMIDYVWLKYLNHNKNMSKEDKMINEKIDFHI